MRRRVIGVMGPGSGAGQETERQAFELGKLIAAQSWILLTGGRAAGVMAAASRGAHAAGGLTLGILPTSGGDAADDVDIAIYTDMGSARNNINVLSSDVVIACGTGPGTASEIALALKAEKEVILLGCGEAAECFFREIGGSKVTVAADAAEAIARVRECFAAGG